MSDQGEFFAAVDCEGCIVAERARVWTLAAEAKGTRCTICQRHFKVYRRKLNTGMATALIWMTRWLIKHREEWVHVPTHCPKFVDRSREQSKLKHWNLTRARPNRKNPAKRDSGVHNVTGKGHLFVYDGLRVPSHVVLCNDRLLEFDGQMVDIKQCLGEPWRYDELMSDHPRWDLFK